MVADLTARAMMDESVMTERLVRRGMRISQDLEINQLAALPVRAVMGLPVATLNALMPLADVLRLLAGAATLTPVGGVAQDPSQQNSFRPQKDSEHASGGLPRQQWTFPVVAADGALVGIVTRGELLDAAVDDERLKQPISTLATHDVMVAHPDDPLGDVLARMAAGDFAMLPVVSDESKRIVGSIDRSDAVRAGAILEERQGRRERFIRSRRDSPTAPLTATLPVPK
jgi:hypothetical protein